MGTVDILIVENALVHLIVSVLKRTVDEMLDRELGKVWGFD